jgi:hypothetical protein
MGLKPVFDSSDAFFNAEAAQSAYELVMKMDEEEARAFTTMVVLDTLWETIEKNQRTLQRHLNQVVAKQAALGAEVAERRGDEELSKALTEISKTTAGRNPYFYGYQFDENDFNRDRRSGQFKAKVNIVTKKPIPDRHAKRLGLPTESSTKLKGEQLAAHQQEFYQIKAFLDAFQDNGLADSVDYLITTDKGTFKHSGTKFPGKAEHDPAEERILAIEARPAGLHAGGAAFGLVGALGGGVEAQDRAGIYTNRAAAAAPAFTEAWLNGAEETTSSNARLYNRVAAGSDFVGNVAPYGSKLQIAAKFGSIVGHQGPEAEKVLGPRTRLTMYRYRGTEKKPDADLTSQYNRLVGGYAGEAISPEAHEDFRQQQVKALTSARRKKGSELTRAERAQAIAAVDKPPSGVSQRSDAGRQRAFQYAVAYMDQKVPKKGLYDLNLKSGVTPPSEGIIIDKNGKIVTQAIGYGDDHYLPFNLKNLTGLRGGEYVRTRSAGGPTREDIYTGLVMGAQRVTVVSRSGVFTVEFDDTFRGGRRYNDKAARMVSRYEKLIDAVKSKDVSRMDVEPSVKRKIAQEVEDDLGDWAQPSAKRKEFNNRIAEYKAYPTLSEEDEAQIATVFERQKTGVESKDRELLADLRNQAQESKAFNYELNGEGYAAALGALQEQFPYYIADAHHLPRPGRQVGRYESEKDRGYVKPRYNRPEEAREGFYDTSIKGTPRASVKDFEGKDTGKYTADSADYQNWKYNKQNERSHQHQSGGRLMPVATEGDRISAKEITPAEVAADLNARKVAESSILESAQAVRKHVRATAKPEDPDTMPWIAMDEDKFETWFKEPKNRAKFEEDLEELEGLTKDGKHVFQNSSEFTAYHAAKGLAGGVKYDPERHRESVPSSPYDFDGRAFKRTNDIEPKRTALQRLQKETPLPGFILAETPAKDFRDALKSAKVIRQVAYEARAENQNPKAYYASAQSRGRVEAGAERYVVNPELADKLVDNVHAAWRLRVNLEDAQKNVDAKISAEGKKAEAGMSPGGRDVAVWDAEDQERKVKAERLKAKLKAHGKDNLSKEVDDLLSNLDLAYQAKANGIGADLAIARADFEDWWEKADGDRLIR